MKAKQLFLSGLMILGLIFSSVMRIRFQFDEGFQFDNFWVRLIPLPLTDICLQSSNEELLTSTFVGYLFYNFFGLLMLKEFRLSRLGVMVLIAFLILCNYALLAELSSVYAGMYQQYDGQYFRIGPLLFVISVILMRRNIRYVKEGRVKL
jgi:hypothetical protein